MSSSPYEYLGSEKVDCFDSQLDDRRVDEVHTFKSLADGKLIGLPSAAFMSVLIEPEQTPRKKSLLTAYLVWVERERGTEGLSEELARLDELRKPENRKLIVYGNAVLPGDRPFTKHQLDIVQAMSTSNKTSGFVMD